MQKNFFDIHIFIFFSSFHFSIMTLSHIKSHTEYLIQTYNILVLILYSKLIRNVAALAVFNTISWRIMTVANFFEPPCIASVTKHRECYAIYLNSNISAQLHTGYRLHLSMSQKWLSAMVWLSSFGYIGFITSLRPGFLLCTWRAVLSSFVVLKSASLHQH